MKVLNAYKKTAHNLGDMKMTSNLSAIILSISLLSTGFSRSLQPSDMVIIQEAPQKNTFFQLLSSLWVLPSSLS